MSRRRGSWLSWGLMAAVLAVALAVGVRSPSEPPTDSERVRAIAETVRCPTCRSQSVAESDAPAAEAVRAEIERRVAAGESDARIRRALADTPFGEEILLTPSSSGITGLVWALPVAGLVVAAAGLAFAFRRWRSPPAPAREGDRELVERALAERDGRRS